MIDHDCEMDVNGKKLGDSKRKGYEEQIKCVMQTPNIRTVSTGANVVGGSNSQVIIDDVMVSGTIVNPGKLRSAAGLGKNTKIPSVKITRLRKLEGKAEDQPTQEVTLTKAIFKDFNIDDTSNTFSAVLDFEKIEIKDHVVKEDGTLGSPIVNTVNRLTNEINA